MAYKAFTYRIKPNSKQQELLVKHTHARRTAWNRVLSSHEQEYQEYKNEVLRLVTSGNVDSYEEDEELLSPMKPQPSRKSLFKKLKSLKKEYPYLEEPYSQVTQQKIQDLAALLSASSNEIPDLHSTKKIL